MSQPPSVGTQDPPAGAPHSPAAVDARDGDAPDRDAPDSLAAAWFLGADERGNPATGIDRRRGDGLAWSAGNEITPLVHGAAYFTELLANLRATEPGDLVLFTDWRGDPDELLDGPDTEVSRVLAEACGRGVDVRGLIWRSHLDKLQFSASENRHLGEEIEAAGGTCLLDMRVRVGGSHHQKMLVLRHPGRPERDVAYVGGIDLCHSRRDDVDHGGDGQPQVMAKPYGPTPPWHDIQLAIRGPAVGDVETTFRERWCDPTPLSRNPLHRLRDALSHDDTRGKPLPPQLPDPAPRGSATAQVLRTYPYRRRGYPFAPGGERSIARAYRKTLRMARDLVYLEDQYLWSAQVVAPLAEALRAQPGLRLMVVVPMHPDQDGVAGAAQIIGRRSALDSLYRAGGDRVAVYGLENHAGTPIYVHAKAAVIDDTWTCVGSDNLNMRSWTHDSEVSCAVLDEPGSAPGDPEPFGRRLRLALSREHLDRADGDDDDLVDPGDAFAAFRSAAAALDGWHTGGRSGPRPPGRLRHYVIPPIPFLIRPLAALSYRWVCDPDGRRFGSRRPGAF